MEKKLSAKDFLRSVFASGGRYTMEQLLNDGMYKEVTMRTAITDLKNPKYSAGPVLFIENDGLHFFLQDEGQDEENDVDMEQEEQGSLVDQVPEAMTVSKGLASWIEDGAGLVLGAFDASFEINDEQDKLTASIELEGTPSTFSEGGRRLSVSTGTNEAVVEVETEDDGRSVRLFVEAIEQGFAHAFCYPVIEIPIARQNEALALTNGINKASKLAHIYMIQIEDRLVPCIKASSISNGQPDSFEHICYAALEVTYRFWEQFADLTSEQSLQSNSTENNEDVVSRTGISFDDIKLFLDDADLNYSVDEDGDIYVKSGLDINMWVSLIQNNTVLKIFTFLRCIDGEEVDQGSALELVNRINYGYLPNTVSYDSGKIWSFYYETLEDGMSKTKFVSLLRRCSNSFANAARHEDIEKIIG